MLPVAIRARNYRSFMGEHRFDLRPLTLFYGDNNAGKSALLRVLPLLSDSVAPDAAGALDLDSRAIYGSGFRDLVWRGELDEDRDPDLALGFEWGAEQAIRAVEYTLIRKQRRVLIRHCAVWEATQKDAHELAWVPLFAPRGRASWR